VGDKHLEIDLDEFDIGPPPTNKDLKKLSNDWGKSALGDIKKGQELLAKQKSLYFRYWWYQCHKDKDFRRDALIYAYICGMPNDIYHDSSGYDSKLAELLWKRGYRHGDHVLIYEPASGAFKERVMTAIYETPSLMPPDMAMKFEEAQGGKVKDSNRTRRKSQPVLSALESGTLIIETWKF
jgi:hypothetical protein